MDILLNKYDMIWFSIAQSSWFLLHDLCLPPFVFVPFLSSYFMSHTLQVVVWGCITSEGRCSPSASATVPFLSRVPTATSDTAGTLQQSARYHQVYTHRSCFFLLLMSQMDATLLTKSLLSGLLISFICSVDMYCQNMDWAATETWQLGSIWGTRISTTKQNSITAGT